jgi:hypothetical protein
MGFKGEFESIRVAMHLGEFFPKTLSKLVEFTLRQNLFCQIYYRKFLGFLKLFLCNIFKSKISVFVWIYIYIIYLFIYLFLTIVSSINANFLGRWLIILHQKTQNKKIGTQFTNIYDIGSIKVVI